MIRDAEKERSELRNKDETERSYMEGIKRRRKRIFGLSSDSKSSRLDVGKRRLQ